MLINLVSTVFLIVTDVVNNKCVGHIFYREIFESDNYSPIPVETEEEYKLVVSRFPFHDAEIEKVTWYTIIL